MGTIDPGLIVINGRVKQGVELKDAEKELDDAVANYMINGASDLEVEKVKNQALSTIEFGEVELLNRAMNLAFSALSGDAGLVNRERALINEVSLQDINRMSRQIFKEENASVLYYYSNKDK
jgi:zinc protease